MTHPTTWWTRLDDGRIRCDVCPRACALHEGQTGLCFVRARQGDQVVLTTYGRSACFCVDPVEKKPLNHFLPGTSVLSFGTAGCNLGCRFCQNWDMSKSREMDTLADAASPRQIADAAVRLGCRSVAFTYNDPVIFMEYALDVADACRERGVKAIALTAGYINANADPVLDTLQYLRHETNVWLEITNLLIPGLNDTPAETDAMTRWIVEHLGPDVPVHFTAFHPDWKLRDRPPTPPATLKRAREIATANGIRHAYTGNVHDPEGQSTRCHGCGAVLIERDCYELGAWRLDDRGRCAACGQACAGVFDGPPGRWGARRLPVRLRRSATAS